MPRITGELARLQEEIEDYARDYGLDFFETRYELLDWDELNEVASYGGLPSRYPHWRFGMEYESLLKGYSWGLSKIYELVINNNPCYAYLMKNNGIVDQKLVMSHVCGHCDFFKNNAWFSKTNRKMVDEMANHAVRIRRYIERYGLERVEDFIDGCLSIENLIDVYSPFIKRAKVREQQTALERTESREPETVRRIEGREYMRDYLNPPELQRLKEAQLEQKQEQARKFPPSPQKDILQFLVDFAPLDPWERDVLSIVREEAYYFAPQGQTKILNEGWASFWHTTIMTQKALKDSELIDYADHHAGTMGVQPGRINPYKLGLELLRDIEERWNKGRYGKDWDECDDAEEKRYWDTGEGGGRQKLFEVRRIYNDVGFIDAFLTPEFVSKQKMFTYAFNARSQEYLIDSRAFEQIKGQLLFGLANHGQPYIEIVDANYENRGELYLIHKFEGIELFLPHCRDTLRNLQSIWRRPVHIETILSGQVKLVSFDGTEHTEQVLRESDEDD